jgi:hypothetical protein
MVDSVKGRTQPLPVVKMFGYELVTPKARRHRSRFLYRSLIQRTHNMVDQSKLISRILRVIMKRIQILSIAPKQRVCCPGQARNISSCLHNPLQIPTDSSHSHVSQSTSTYLARHEHHPTLFPKDTLLAQSVLCINQPLQSVVIRSVSLRKLGPI